MNVINNREMVIAQICLVFLGRRAGLAIGLQKMKDQTFINNAVSSLSISGEGVVVLEGGLAFSFKP